MTESERSSRLAKLVDVDGDAGDTLIEVLFAILVLAISATALFGAFSTVLTISGAQQGQSILTGLLSNYAETVVAQVEFGSPAKYLSCATPNHYKTNLDFTDFNQKLSQLNSTTATPYVVELTEVDYWTEKGFSTQCPPGSKGPQQMIVFGVDPDGVKTSLTFSVQNLDYNGPMPSVPTVSLPSQYRYIAGSGGPTQFIPIQFQGVPTPILTCLSVDRNAPCQKSLDGNIDFNQGATSSTSTAYLVLSPKTPKGTFHFSISATNGFPTTSAIQSSAITVVVE